MYHCESWHAKKITHRFLDLLLYRLLLDAGTDDDADVDAVGSGADADAINNVDVDVDADAGTNVDVDVNVDDVGSTLWIFS